MQGTMGADSNTGGTEEARNEKDQVVLAVAELEQAVAGISNLNINIPQPDLPAAAQVVNAGPFPAQGEPAGRGPLEARPAVLPNAPPEPDAYGGAAQQEMDRITGRLDEIARLQQSINEVSKNMYILPEETAGEIGSINRQIVQMEKALNFLEENPFHMDS